MTNNQGRAYKNCPVGNFSEGATLQGSELKTSSFFIRLFNVLTSVPLFRGR